MATKTTESSRISIFVNAKNGDKLIKLWQLLISDEMEHVLNKSKSTILVGGTLKPFEDFVSVLMPNLKKKIEYFSCGHIVEDDKIAAFCLKNGPTNKIFDFCLANRKDEKMLKDLAFALLNFSISIPAGIVCFFQSFSYLTQIINFWKQNGLFDKLNNKKKIFIEPKNNSDVKDILNQYYNSIKFDNGGFLFCVYGGKFSEGINFKDDLARGVVCIGVPYPNRKDLELNERINYFNKIKNKSGDKFYQNICIKTINQSIGRAIRWREDFACIILIDKRYSLDENLSEGISDWIKKKKINCSKFGQCIKGVRSFFKQK
ncbi:ATP-dependent DNA helicase chl1 [Bonamia ostreae]|uniref:ATP-dependent DNA helicase chl1 n=1 Tax=Bonamia ostreae TaxID=126728 RepID=A0ABV2AFK7_9EUKA